MSGLIRNACCTDLSPRRIECIDNPSTFSRYPPRAVTASAHGLSSAWFPLCLSDTPAPVSIKHNSLFPFTSITACMHRLVRACLCDSFFTAASWSTLVCSSSLFSCDCNVASGASGSSRARRTSPSTLNWPIASAKRNWAPSTGCTPSPNWSDRKWWRDTPPGPRQSAIQRLLRAGEEHCLIRSRCHPGHLEPPHSLLADFIRGGPVNLPRASSGRIQGHLRRAPEEGIQRLQITPTIGQRSKTLIRILFTKTGHPFSLEHVFLNFPGYSLTPIIHCSNPSKYHKATPQIPQHISPSQETESEIPRKTHTTRMPPHQWYHRSIRPWIATVGSRSIDQLAINTGVASKSADQQSLITNEVVAHMSMMSIDEGLNRECIEEHNRLRALHGCAPLTLDPELARKAQLHAEELAAGKEHIQSNEYGENVAMRKTENQTTLTGKQATLMWYREIASYEFGVENQLNCGHFSQVVWKSTTHAGFGRALKPDGRRIFVVGIYLPPANFNNEWTENVPAPLSGVIYTPTLEDIEEIPVSQTIGSRGEEGILPYGLTAWLAADEHPGMNGLPNSQPLAPLKRDHGIHTECVLQESTVYKRKSSHKSLDEMFVNVRERFRRYNQTDTSAETYDVETWYSSLTMDKIMAWATWKYPSPRASSGWHGKLSHPLNTETAHLEAFRCEVLHTHNRYRAMHGVPDLKRSATLDALALNWAKELQKTGTPAYWEHEYGNSLVGENVADRITECGKITGQTLVEKWYKESELYDYSTEPNSVEYVGHFTQMIWKGSKEIGVGIAPSRDLPNRAFIVCFYNPPGNAKGEYRANVFPPIVHF
ncbi:hypothetical protein T265_06948 [Opisthorchis viverrini]|uniref:SCP domain-containing protein n=1 Tax=Opisthorchis viverrini TaxID=6198 RepID=A0A075ACW4_OPIVI|nr:hypothetical protein T265_06948 [Opisthorchis viverrini]KER25659.1 hypothetical protein T265_06948 [Opisthorchis viverrini]